MNFYNILNLVTFYLVIAGALNWGLVGAFHLNLIERILGSNSFITRVIYILVGLSALYLLWHRF